jgi:hypothetical protein
MSFGGTYHLEDTIYIPFTNRAFSTGIPTALVSGVIDIYEDVTATPIITAETLTVSLNGHAGFNMVTITATAASGFEAGKSYSVVLDAGTVDSVSVVGEVVGQFNIITAAAGTDFQADIATLIANLATVDTNVDDIETAVITNAAGADIAADIIAVKAETALIVADTGTDGVVLANDAITSAKIANDAIGATEIADGAIDAATFAAGAIDAAAIATDAIDADALASDAVTEIRSVVTGTSDAGGSTTTMVDAALTEGDDYYNGMIVLFTSGSVVNQSRLITDFDAATDTVTFAPAVAASVGAGITYEILPGSSADIQTWLGSVPNALVSGAVDADVSAFQAGVITAAAIATDAIGADEFAQGAADKVWDTASRILTASTNFNDLSAAEVNTEVADVLKVDTISEMGQATPAVTPTFQQAIMWMYMALTKKVDVSSTFKEFHNDAGTLIWKKAISEAGGVYTEAKGETGP